MRLLHLSWQNLLAKPLSTLLSLLLLVLGVSIISLLLLLNQQLTANFNQNIRGIDMVVGAKGSPLSLILSAVYHIENPTGNIPLAEAEPLLRHPLVQRGIPLAYGDNYEGYRILGTDSSYLAHYGASLAQGRAWEAPFEVTLGATAAARLGLAVGDSFYGAHGVAGSDDVHEDHPYRVVGLLGATGTVVDQLILTGVESVWDIHAKPGETADTSARELTALLLQFRNPAMGFITLTRYINQQTSMQAALPAIEINRLLNKLLPIALNTGKGMAFAIMLISAISVFISLYNSLKERRYELALLRSLGASRPQLLLLLLLEGGLLAALGGGLGLIFSRLGLWLLNATIVADYHYDMLQWAPLPAEGWLWLATFLIGLLAALIPGL
ncbi:MAG: ABC transporter permease, partial [Bacteroidetes bacterium]